MIEDTIARKYAGALFELSKAKGIIDTSLAELKWINGLLAEQQSLQVVLNHPLIPRTAKEEICRDICQRQGVSEIISRFLSLLLEKDRFRLLGQIYDNFLELLAAYQQVCNINLHFAVPLGEAREAQIQKRVQAALALDKVSFSTSYDVSLIAGMVITLSDQVIDGSIAGKLKNLQRQLGE